MPAAIPITIVTNGPTWKTAHHQLPLLNYSTNIHFSENNELALKILRNKYFKFRTASGDGSYVIRIAVPNFTKVGQTGAEISHFTIFKMAVVRHLGFFLNF